MKTRFSLLFLAAALLVFAVAGTGCATDRDKSIDYLQRPLRVAIVPGVNRTDQPQATMVFDKAWEEALAGRSYQVVSADRVVSYGGASGQSLEDIRHLPAQKLGQDLKVDAILTTEVLRWKNSYKVIESDTTVSGLGLLVDARTGATIWEHKWIYQESSNQNNNNGLVGMLVGAAVDAAISSAIDKPAHMAKQGVNMSVNTMPIPGTAPATSSGTGRNL